MQKHVFLRNEPDLKTVICDGIHQGGNELGRANELLQSGSFGAPRSSPTAPAPLNWRWTGDLRSLFAARSGDRRRTSREPLLFLVLLWEGFFEVVEEAFGLFGDALEDLADLVGDGAQAFFEVVGLDADVGQFDLAHDGEQDESGDVGGIGDVGVRDVDVERGIALGRFGVAVVLEGDGADVEAEFVDGVFAGTLTGKDDAFEFHGVRVALVGFDDDELLDVDEHVVEVRRAAEQGAEAVVDVELRHIDEHFLLELRWVHEREIAHIDFAGEKADVDGADLQREPRDLFGADLDGDAGDEVAGKEDGHQKNNEPGKSPPEELFHAPVLTRFGRAIKPLVRWRRKGLRHRSRWRRPTSFKRANSLAVRSLADTIESARFVCAPECIGLCDDPAGAGDEARERHPD